LHSCYKVLSVGEAKRADEHADPGRPSLPLNMGASSEPAKDAGDVSQNATHNFDLSTLPQPKLKSACPNFLTSIIHSFLCSMPHS